VRRALAFIVIALSLFGAPALAVQPDEILHDPALESRARALSQELRCMVCQNQSIDDSDAPLAKDLRVLVRERLTAGDSDGQVIDFLVARYGEFVLLKPRFSPHTLVLWLLPPLALLGGGLALWTYSRRRSKFPDAEGQELLKLTAEEEARLERLIAAEIAPDSRPEQPVIASEAVSAKTSG
jgi:cytochrome c-type biogenesis protein CcmH